eukprot:1415431-Amphidinium_carterae.1
MPCVHLSWLMGTPCQMLYDIYFGSAIYNLHKELQHGPECPRFPGSKLDAHNSAHRQPTLPLKRTLLLARYPYEQIINTYR